MDDLEKTWNVHAIMKTTGSKVFRLKYLTLEEKHGGTKQGSICIRDQDRWRNSKAVSASDGCTIVEQRSTETGNSAAVPFGGGSAGGSYGQRAVCRGCIANKLYMGCSGAFLAVYDKKAVGLTPQSMQQTFLSKQGTTRMSVGIDVFNSVLYCE